ncbi:MAG: hypothetical protein LKF79_04565 [Solobacterium sp.]|jgi:hypothetical protein|nr:hypothetical protein [Solobacterium sp.]MCH4222115.1 hypothetical protein [Solobacterium sp.]MCH4265898.1 hypothetical protein [Solobacterium sp.]
MKRLFVLFISGILLISSSGCSSGSSSVSSQSPAVSTASAESSASSIDTLGDVSVDQNLFSVEITIPSDLVSDDTTQETLDASCQKYGWKSAVLNEDGSVTYVMTKAQHAEMMSQIKESLDQTLSEMPGSDTYPSMTAVDHNDDFTSFTVTTTSTTLGAGESISVLVFYMYGALYNKFNGTDPDNYHVDFVNADTGSIIQSADSKDMASSN